MDGDSLQRKESPSAPLSYIVKLSGQPTIPEIRTLFLKSFFF